MFFIVNSQHRATLMQLATGAGKSLMFGLMACFINTKNKCKVAVVVPNGTLAAIQQDKYCSKSCKVQSALFDEAEMGVFYCTYDDLLTGNIPTTTVLLVDEVDTLFFSDSPAVVNK